MLKGLIIVTRDNISVGEKNYLNGFPTMHSARKWAFHSFLFSAFVDTHGRRPRGREHLDWAKTIRNGRK